MTLRGFQSLAPLKEVNDRCIEMLAAAARKERAAGSLTLVAHLKDVLLRVTPEIRARAAGAPCFSQTCSSPARPGGAQHELIPRGRRPFRAGGDPFPSPQGSPSPARR